MSVKALLLTQNIGGGMVEYVLCSQYLCTYMLASFSQQSIQPIQFESAQGEESEKDCPEISEKSALSTTGSNNERRLPTQARNQCKSTH